VPAAAYARLSLHLLGLGAPAELVDAAARAQIDEIRHAKLAFSLASHYSGERAAWGELCLRDVFQTTSPEDIVRTVVLEGCLFGACATLEALRGVELCRDPVVRRVLSTFAADEARHAELAWKIVRWMLARDACAADAVCKEIERAAPRPVGLDVQASSWDEDLRAFGILDKSLRKVCLWRAYQNVVLPCQSTLLALTRRPAVVVSRLPQD
jgi:hypothetical protein